MYVVALESDFSSTSREDAEILLRIVEDLVSPRKGYFILIFFDDGENPYIVCNGKTYSFVSFSAISLYDDINSTNTDELSLPEYLIIDGRYSERCPIDGIQSRLMETNRIVNTSLEHRECYWCEFFNNFGKYVFSEPFTPYDLIRLTAKDIAVRYYYHMPAIISLAKFHMFDIPVGLFEEIERHVPDDIRNHYGRIVLLIYDDREDPNNRDILFSVEYRFPGSSDNPEMDYNHEVRRNNRGKSSRF